MSTAIRLAQVSDAPALARLRWEHRESRLSGEAFAEFSADFSEWIRGVLQSERWSIAVADGSGSPCGCMYLERVTKVPDPGRIRRQWGYVTSSYVEPTWRGRGVGAAMLDYLVMLGRRSQLEFLLLWPSPESVAFYERAGFRPAESFQAVDGSPGPFELRL